MERFPTSARTGKHRYLSAMRIVIRSRLIRFWSTQHDPEVTQEQLHQDIRKEVIVPVLQNFLTEDTRILINPTGRFVIF